MLGRLMERWKSNATHMGGYTADRPQWFTDGDAYDVAESVSRGEARAL